MILRACLVNGCSACLTNWCSRILHSAVKKMLTFHYSIFLSVPFRPADQGVAGVFLLLCLILIFVPPQFGVSAFVGCGFFAFLFIGLPWYILAVKDKVENRRTISQEGGNFKIHSFTLLAFGLLCASIGVAIDMFIIYTFISEPSATTLFAGFTRLLVGLPFFGFGAYLIYLSVGFREKET